jgi:hypothetical protein
MRLKHLLITQGAPSQPGDDLKRLGDDLEQSRVHLLIFNNPLSSEFFTAQDASCRGQNKTHTTGRQLAAANQALLDAYFKFAEHVMDPFDSWVHVMFSSNCHYHQWHVLEIARLHGFELDTFGLFDYDVPGYKPVHFDGACTGDYMVLPMVCMFKSKSKQIGPVGSLNWQSAVLSSQGSLSSSCLCLPLGGAGKGKELLEWQWLRASETLDKALHLTLEAEELLKRSEKMCHLTLPLADRVVHYWQKHHYSKALKLLSGESKSNPDAADAHDLICRGLCQQRAQVRVHSLAGVQGAICFNGFEGHLIGYNSDTLRFQVSIVNASFGTVVKAIKIQNLTFLSERTPEASHVPPPVNPAEGPKVLLLTFSRIPAMFHRALLEDPRLAECRQALEAQGLAIKIPGGANIFVNPEHYEPLMEVLRGRRFRFQTWHIFVEPALEHLICEIADEVNNHSRHGTGRVYRKDTKVVPLSFASKIMQMGFANCVLKTFIDIKLPNSMRSTGASGRLTKSTTDADPRKKTKRRQA